MCRSSAPKRELPITLPGYVQETPSDSHSLARPAGYRSKIDMNARISFCIPDEMIEILGYLKQTSQIRYSAFHYDSASSGLRPGVTGRILHRATGFCLELLKLGDIQSGVI